MDQSSNTVYSSRPYTIALTITILLFLAMLTAVIVLIIIGNAREETREDEFEMTLTAVWADVIQTQAVCTITPTPAPPVTYGEYPFTLTSDSPTYSAAPTCDEQILTGLVLDENGQPTDGFSVLVWGDHTPTQTLPTGQVAGQTKGRWTLPLTNMVHRRVWVQLIAGDRHLSAPIEIVLDQAACDRNQVEIVLEQTAPLN